MTLRMKVICQMVDDDIIVALLTMFCEVVLKRGGINFQGKQEYLNTTQKYEYMLMINSDVSNSYILQELSVLN